MRGSICERFPGTNIACLRFDPSERGTCLFGDLHLRDNLGRSPFMRRHLLIRDVKKWLEILHTFPEAYSYYGLPGCRIKLGCSRARDLMLNRLRSNAALISKPCQLIDQRPPTITGPRYSVGVSLAAIESVAINESSNDGQSFVPWCMKSCYW